MKLNARQVETAKPKDKPYKLADGGGMYLEVFPNGTKSWRMKYRIAGKEKRVVFGVYPTITLADARSKRDDAKKLLVNGVDPSAFKKESKLAQIEEVRNTFQQIALEWHNMKVKKWSAGYASRILKPSTKMSSRSSVNVLLQTSSRWNCLTCLKRWKSEVRLRKLRKYVSGVVKCFATP